MAGRETPGPSILKKCTSDRNCPNDSKCVRFKGSQSAEEWRCQKKNGIGK